MKFFTSDWRSDPRLKMCSAGARGVWIEMICLMHEATPYGHLLVHGQTPNEAQLASLTGIPSAELSDHVAELERMGVFSRTKEGVIYSRKLVRMAAKSAKARKSGKLGGNPSLCNNDTNPQSDKQPDKGSVKTHIPEAKGQNITTTTCSQIPAQDRGGGHRDLVSERDQILIAAKIDVSKDTSGKWYSSETLHEISQWFGLGLDLSQILTTIEDVMRSRDGPPGSLKYFRTAMQRAAGRKAEMPLVPIADTAKPHESERMKRYRRIHARYGDPAA